MPVAKFQMPDGRIGRFEVPEGTTPDQAQSLIQQHLSGSNPAQAITDASTPGIIDAGANLLSGAVAGPVSGLAGLAAAAGKGLGITDADPADVVKSTQNALTYDPKTTQGKQIAGAIAKPFEMLAAGADKAGSATADASGSPLLGAAVNTAIQAIPLIAGKVLPKGAGAVDASARVAAAQAARDAGYVLTPSEAGAGIIPRSVEGLAGGPTMERLASKKNATTTNTLVKQDIGLPDDAPVTRADIAQVRADAGPAYEAIKQFGVIKNDKQYFNDLNNISSSQDTAAASYAHRIDSNPIQKVLDGLRTENVSSASAIEEVKLLRNEADRAFATGDKGLGRAYRSAAQAVDDSLSRYLEQASTKRVFNGEKHVGQTYDMDGNPVAEGTPQTSNLLSGNSNALTDPAATGVGPAGEPVAASAKKMGSYTGYNDPALADAFAKYQAARKLIAKTYLADKALNPASGDFNASVYAKALDKGVPLDGPAATIGNFALQFPKLAQRAERVQNAGGPKFMDLGLSALSALKGGGSIAGTIASLGARPALRSAMLSNPAQALMGGGPTLAELGSAAANFQGSPALSLAEMASGQR